jgi:putative addiction module killer protein
VRAQELRVYQLRDGEQPFTTWLAALKDLRARARVRTRIDRLALGNQGDCKALDGGVSELRINWGPGYRVYFARIGTTLLLLPCAGDKTTQPQDIERAKSYLQDYKERTAKPQGQQKRQGKGRKRAV